jgi:hypothetical protein
MFLYILLEVRRGLLSNWVFSFRQTIIWNSHLLYLDCISINLGSSSISGGLSSPAAYGSEVPDLAHSDAPTVLDPAVPVDQLFHSLCIFYFCCTSFIDIGCVLTPLCFWFQYVLLLSRLLTGLLQSTAFGCGSTCCFCTSRSCFRLIDYRIQILLQNN